MAIIQTGFTDREESEILLAYRKGTDPKKISYQVNSERSRKAQRIARREGGPILKGRVKPEEVVQLLKRRKVLRGESAERQIRRLAAPRFDVPANFRARVLARDGNQCQTPSPNCFGRLEADHIVPVKDGGSSEITNGITLCRLHHKVNYLPS